MTDSPPNDQVIGNYRLEGLLGAGAVGQVFRARHVGTGQAAAVQVAAVKVLLIDPSADPDFQRRFQDEIQAAAGLRHPNIVEIYEFGESGGRLFLAMELATEGSLRTLLQQRAGDPSVLPLSLGLDLVRQAAEALGFAHAHGIIHRNVKPENLLLFPRPDATPGYLLKVGDYGLAGLRRAIAITGVPVGTPAYLSPEQCLGQPPDGLSDLYSLGVVLYEIATGTLPFSAERPADVIAMHVNTPPKPPSQLRTDIPPELEAIILRCLAKSPHQRFATGEELSRELQEVMAALAPSTFIPQPQPPVPPSPSAATAQPAPGAAIPPVFPSPPAAKADFQVEVLNAQGQQLALRDLTGEGLSIGRGADNDVVLDVENIAAHHVYIDRMIDRQGNRVSVTDPGSQGGTLLNGKPLPPNAPQIWETGSLIQIGPFWLRLIAPIAQPAAVPMPQPTPPLAVSAPTPPARAPQPVPATPPPQGPMTDAGGRSAASPTPGQTPQNVNVTRIQLLCDQETLTLTPGQTSVFRMTVVNAGKIVDHFTVTADGVPHEWIQGPAPVVELLPGTRLPVALSIQAPHEPESLAGPYSVTIYARSRKVPNEAGIAQVLWTVLPFYENNLEVQPKRSSGWRDSKYKVVLTNNGNARVNHTLSGSDDEQTLDYDFNRSLVILEPGTSATIPLAIRAPIRWLGTAQPRGFTVQSKLDKEKKGEMLSSAANFVQRAIIPVWLVPLLVIAFGVIVYWITRPPIIEPVVTIPTVVVAKLPVTLRWHVSNANNVQLPNLTLTPVADGIYEHKFDDAAAIPPGLRLFAYSQFGVRKVATVAIAVNTQTPTLTSTPTSTPTPTLTLTPLPPTLTPTVTPTLTSEPTPIPTSPPTEGPSPTTTSTPTPPNQVICPRGQPIIISGIGGPAGQPFLLYFNGRPVSGGIVEPDGIYRATLVVQQEAPGEYPVMVVLRDDPERVLALFTYQITRGRNVLLFEPGRSGAPQEVTCIILTATPVPTATTGVIVFPQPSR